VISKVDPAFWKSFNDLPRHTQRLIEKDFRLWQENPFHTSLYFKKVHSRIPVWSARCGLNYRVVGLREGDTMYWFFLGNHVEYERLLKSL
jgi:mRNA-degrading endonuclease RelE of RelBE toxin-antitoxin system